MSEEDNIVDQWSCIFNELIEYVDKNNPIGKPPIKIAAMRHTSEFELNHRCEKLSDPDWHTLQCFLENPENTTSIHLYGQKYITLRQIDEDGISFNYFMQAGELEQKMGMVLVNLKEYDVVFFAMYLNDDRGAVLNLLKEVLISKF